MRDGYHIPFLSRHWPALRWSTHIQNFESIMKVCIQSEILNLQGNLRLKTCELNYPLSQRFIIPTTLNCAIRKYPFHVAKETIARSGR